MEAFVILDRQGSIARLIFNRPQQFNAIDLPSARELLTHCQSLIKDTTVRAVILQGQGKSFGTGGDVAAMHADAQGVLPPLIDTVHAAVSLLTSMDAPVIARLHGVVAGGGLGLALACDFAIAADNTRFNFAYAKLGASCDAGSSWTLTRLVGLRNALEIALLSQDFNATDALRMGIVNHIVPLDKLDASVNTLAEQLAGGPTAALGRIKRLMRTASQNSFSDQLNLERDEFLANAQSSDFQHGVAAFMKKAKPIFTGR
jgi:2-(1,2-epoxy-1,2-dihydrophenyl)acetyl-CoA isomerase